MPLPPPKPAEKGENTFSSKRTSKPLPAPPGVQKTVENETEDKSPASSDDEESDEEGKNSKNPLVLFTRADENGNENEPYSSSPEKRVIGKSVLQVATPSRKPPPPPEDDEEDVVTIRVSGVVSPMADKDSNQGRDRPTTWITRTEPAKGNVNHPQFLHTRSPANLFPQDEDASKLIIFTTLNH